MIIGINIGPHPDMTTLEPPAIMATVYGDWHDDSLIELDPPTNMAI